MAEPESGTIIEGVGDDVIRGLVGVVVVIVPILVTMFHRFTRHQQIHPENVQRVQETRQHLNRNDAASTANTSGAGDTRNQNRGPSYTVDGTCPVCLQERQLSTETNCGHVFCGDCLIAYWRHGNWLGAIACPVCRQQVTILFPVFQEDPNSDEANRMMDDINNYNRRFSGESRPFMDYIYDLPTLLRHIFQEFFSFSGLVWMFRFRIFVCFVAALLYFISPLDIIPEAVFGVLGLLDDVFVILLLAIYVSIIYRGVIANRGNFDT
ncbi:hypothetical protein BSL78_21634 [Apostichopus japonicus]|uniref:E3 ubiquitin-protein ligase RNF170 n=1 Tax=Stichopus japonicus TaxID=307972 RepID=A0A2G8K0I7_STIJA|nr:hypothetical protein BSL78_21634 [Apostichopus japonicus]